MWHQCRHGHSISINSFETFLQLIQIANERNVVGRPGKVTMLASNGSWPSAHFVLQCTCINSFETFSHIIYIAKDRNVNETKNYSSSSSDHSESDDFCLSMWSWRYAKSSGPNWRWDEVAGASNIGFWEDTGGRESRSGQASVNGKGELDLGKVIRDWETMNWEFTVGWVVCCVGD